MITIQQINGSLIEDLHQKAIEQALIPLLATYQIIPQLVCESVIDHAIANVDCTSEEINAACQQFYQQWNLITAEQQQTWRSHCGLNQAQFEEMTTRSLRVEKFKQYTWGHKLESHFLERKQEFDRVIYSLLRTKERLSARAFFSAL